jgi:hypothetical protein
VVDSTFFVEQEKSTKCHQKVSQASFEIQYDGRNNPTVGSQALINSGTALTNSRFVEFRFAARF